MTDCGNASNLYNVKCPYDHVNLASRSRLKQSSSVSKKIMKSSLLPQRDTARLAIRSSGRAGPLTSSTSNIAVYQTILPWTGTLRPLYTPRDAQEIPSTYKLSCKNIDSRVAIVVPVASMVSGDSLLPSSTPLPHKSLIDPSASYSTVPRTSYSFLVARNCLSFHRLPKLVLT